MSASSNRPAPRRTYAVGTVIVCGCLIAILSFGPRSAVGAFQQPILTTNHWDTTTFSVALAIQNLLWGVGQPFAGAIADRFGAVRVLMIGAVLYAAGLVIMAL